MRCFRALVVFACAFGVITATVDVEDAQSQPKEAETIEIESDIRNGGEAQTDFKSSESAKEFQVNSNELSVESDAKTNYEVVDTNTSSDTSESTNQVTKDSVDEVDTNISSKEIDNSSNTDDKPKEIDTSANEDEKPTEIGNSSNEDENSEEIDNSSNEDEKSQDIGTSSNEDDKSKQIDTSNSNEDGNNNSFAEVDTNSTSSSEEIDEKTDDIPIDVRTHDPSEELTVSTDSPTAVTEIVFPNQKVIGLNIGLYFVLEELRRRSTFPFPGRVPTELVVKVLMLSSKIEKEGGEVIPLNKNMMKIISDLIPTSFKDAVCSPP